MSVATLLNDTITTAQTAAVSAVYHNNGGPIMNAQIQAAFTYGSGGTTATTYVQTSFDGGTTWIDVVAFGFTTSSAVKIANLSSLTPVTTLYTPTDGALTANTAKDGIIGPIWRTKTTTTGTYAGSTTLIVTLMLNIPS